MRSGNVGWWAALGGMVFLGCGAGNAPDNGSTGPGIQTSHVLTVHTSGSGAIRSAAPPFDCSAQCTQTVNAGAQVQLTALPAAGWTFTGWLGGCSGNGGCALVMDADHDVTAIFAALPPPPPAGNSRVSVNFSGNGAGRVTSSPPGLDCPGACTTTFPTGTAVTLTAKPDASSTFAGFGGACSGTACTLSASADKTVYANFTANGPPPPPPVDSCAGIAPPDAVAMRQFVHPLDGHSFECFAGMGDKDGLMAFGRSYHDSSAHGSSFDFVTTDGTRLQDTFVGSEGPHPLQQLVGLTSWGDRGHLDPLGGKVVMINNFDSGGKPASPPPLLFYNKIAGAAESREGTLLAGDISTSQSGPMRHAAIMYSGGGTRPVVLWGPQPLASAGDVFGAGVDLLGRSLVITDGTVKFGPGNISGQWFGPDGTPLTDEFVMVSGFTAGPSTWFETSALIGSGLLVRRMDHDATFHAHALVVVASGAATVQPAPAWMTSRPDTHLQVARGNRAYAVTPYGAKGVACSQRVEVLAADGTSCGATNYPIAAGNCDTGDLTLAEDGTLIQPLPRSMEGANPNNGSHTCTWRWWTAALR